MSLPRVEWPTLGLLAATWCGWLALTLGWHLLPLPVVVVAAGVCLALHNSLQHEAVHGHPTRSTLVNSMLVGAPLSLWLPYPLYRQSHIAHHRSSSLTDPYDDPESFYVDGASWARTSRVGRLWLVCLQTLLGRLVLGPPHTVATFLLAELRRPVTRARLRAWTMHFGLVAAVLVWVVGVCDVGVAEYLLCAVWPGLSLTLLRSFAEHCPARDDSGRIAIVEAEPPFGLLFLHNNLHALHHAEPGRPWYELPERYRERRHELIEGNGGYLFRGYLDVARRYLLRPKDHPVHPERSPC